MSQSLDLVAVTKDLEVLATEFIVFENAEFVLWPLGFPTDNVLIRQLLKRVQTYHGISSEHCWFDTCTLHAERHGCTSTNSEGCLDGALGGNQREPASTLKTGGRAGQSA